jgi:hypothetical protein
MNGATDGGVPFGIWVGGNVQGVTIAHLTIRDVYYHPDHVECGRAINRSFHNVRLVNAGTAAPEVEPRWRRRRRSTTASSNTPCSNTTRPAVTTTRMAWTSTRGDNWIIRHNLFRNIRAPQGQLAGPAILMWNHSTNTLVDGNTFIDCQREIALGLIERTPTDHAGGIVRNNFIYRQGAGDSAIYVGDSPNNPGSAQLHLHLRHLRQPDRVPLSSHDGHRDREQRARRASAGTRWRDRLGPRAI